METTWWYRTYVVVSEDSSEVVAWRLSCASQTKRMSDLESGRKGKTLSKIGSCSIEEEVGEVGFYRIE
jgi:hypothetical protein